MSISISNIQQLPYEVTGKISNYLNDKDLSKIALTNRNFHRQVEDNKTQWFSKTGLQVKERQYTVNSLENLKINIKSSLLYRFIYFINDPKSPVLYAIFRVAKRIFSCVQKMAYQQKELRSRIKDKVSNLSEAKKLLRHAHLFYRRMEDIFGDIHAYEKIPVLDISNKKFGDYIDNIKPEDMTASVMRGTDTLGRRFISVRAIDRNGEKVVQTFFERYTNRNRWVSAGHNSIIPFHMNWINESGALNPYEADNYEKLKTLIRTGETTIAYRGLDVDPNAIEEHMIRLV